MIRDYAESDKETLEKIHEESNFDYQFPTLSDPLFVVKKVVDEDGVRQGMAVKIEGTVYLWMDTEWGTPHDRWLKFQELVEAAKRAAWENGLDTLTCVVPPEIDRRFAKRLRKIGMTPDRPWRKWSFDLNGYVPRS